MSGSGQYSNGLGLAKALAAAALGEHRDSEGRLKKNCSGTDMTVVLVTFACLGREYLN